MKYTPYFLSLLALCLAGCDQKQEDHSALEEVVHLDDENEDAPLVQEFSDRSLADESQPMPQERIIQEEDLR